MGWNGVLVALFSLLWLASCSDDNPVNGGSGGQGGNGDPDGNVKPEIPALYASLPGTLIAQDETWSRDTTLAGPHFVLPGVTLTIEPGVTVKFEYHDGVAEDVGTIITLSGDETSFSTPRPSGRLVAEGTADRPIVFTSARTNPQKNDWGGIILTGDAPNNIPGGRGEVEGIDHSVNYGGEKDDDDSGILRYVRIEYTGYSIAEGSELQALTLYSVGSGTTLEFINIYEVSDDGIEIFGGTADVKYLVVYGADDDTFDFDQGWRGRGQFWLGVQKENADNGFENDGCDNLSDCDGGNGPTRAQLWNVTVIGPGDGGSPAKGNHGMLLRENLQGSYNNMVLAGFDGPSWVLEGGDAGEEADETYTSYPDLLELNGIIVWGNGAWEEPEGGLATVTDAVRYAASYEETDPQFSDPDRFDFSLRPDSPALEGGVLPPNDGFFEQVTFRGAFGTENWAAGSWVRWPGE